MHGLNKLRKKIWGEVLIYGFFPNESLIPWKRKYTKRIAYSEIEKMFIGKAVEFF